MPKIKLLFDQNISYRILSRLPEIFSDSCQVRMAGLENMTDLKIWQYAKNNGFTIVTFDADFYDMNIIRGYPPKILWLRTGNLCTSAIANLLIANVQSISAFIDNPEEGCLKFFG